MICPKCGEEYVRGATECFDCRVNLVERLPEGGLDGAEEAPMWTCGKCGEELEDEFSSCWSCGTGRDGSAAGDDFVPVDDAGDALVMPDAGPGGSASVTGAVGTFHSVHRIATVMEIVRIGVGGQLSSPDEGVGQGGVLASIYLSELSDRRLVVTAGNVLESYFSFAVDLTEDDTGTQGRAYYDRPMDEMTRWTGNAMKLASGVQAVLIDASATINEWDIGGSE